MGVTSKDGSDGSEGSEGKEGGSDRRIVDMNVHQQVDMSRPQLSVDFNQHHIGKTELKIFNF